MPQRYSKIWRLIVYRYQSVAVSIALAFGICMLRTDVYAQNAEKYSIPRVGDQALDFSLQDFKGNKFTLSKLTKKNGVLLWFTNLCEGCQSEIPTVLKLKAEYEKKGVEVVAVSVLGKDRTKVETVIKENKVSFRFLYDPTGTATKMYSGKYVEGTCPLKNIFIVEKGGKIVYASHLPGADPSALEKELNKITVEDSTR